MKHNKARIVGALALLIALLTPRVQADEPINTTLFGNLAVKGYDPVAYFTDGKAVKGSKVFEVEWHGATWRFASATNRAAFVSAPETYAPQYGGYCAWAMSQNKKAPIDPDVWKIVDGKLYLNYSKSVQAKWEEDIPGLIKQADKNWDVLVADEGE